MPKFEPKAIDTAYSVHVGKDGPQDDFYKTPKHNYTISDKNMNPVKPTKQNKKATANSNPTKLDDMVFSRLSNKDISDLTSGHVALTGQSLIGGNVMGTMFNKQYNRRDIARCWVLL